jgi:hypothetical protein
MKRHRKRERANFERERVRKRIREQRGGFKCCNCRLQVVVNAQMGTHNRNHCNMCLWSRHVDEKKGDRRATCQAGMRPIGLTFRIESRGRRGEIMLIHACSGCPKISINRIAADDLDTEIVGVFNASLEMSDGLRRKVLGQGIIPAIKADNREIQRQLYGAR